MAEWRYVQLQNKPRSIQTLKIGTLEQQHPRSNFLPAAYNGME